MKHIAELRKEADLTQTELATRLNISQQAISKYEKEERDPDIDVLIRIGKFFNVSTDFLLGLTDQKSPYGYTAHSDIGNSINENVGENINYWVEKTGYGNDQMADKLEIPVDLLNDYCTGLEHPPLNILQALSEICEVSTDCLLGLREKSRPQNYDGNYPFKFDAEISNRLKALAKKRDESYDILAVVLDIEEEEVFNFFEYGFVTHISVFVKIVEHYLVSSDYLLNRTGSTLTVQAEEEELIKAYRNLNAKSKVMALSKIYELEREDSLVAAKDRYLDDQGKSSPSNGTEGGTMVG